MRKKTIITWDATTGISRMASVQVCGDTAQVCGTANESKTTYTYWGNTLLPATVTQIDAARGESLVTTNTYDLAGRLTVSDGPLAGTGDATYYLYDNFGRQTWQIGPADSSGKRQAKQTTYRNSDDKVVAVETGYVTSVTTPVLMSLVRTETEYNAHRNPTIERVLNAGIPYTLTQKTFDDRGRLTCEARRMNSAAFGSLPSDACTLGATGSFGDDRITRNVYDNGSQLLQVQRAYGTSLQQNYSTYTYSPNGQQKAVKDSAGNLTSYEYDGFDRISKIFFPVAATGNGASSTTDYEQYGYDAAGNRISVRKRDAKVLTYAYDGMNRVRSKTVPISTSGAASYSVFYGYDVRGLQTFIRFSSITGTGVTNQYDGFGWLRSSSTNMDGTARVVTYNYDVHGNRTRITHPDGNYFEYAYEPTDNLMFISENGPSVALISNIYDDFGRRKLINRDSGGSVTSVLYDEISRLKSLGHNLDGNAAGNDVGIGFSYNPVSQVVARSQTNSTYDYPIAAVNSVYAANGRNQITTISGTGGGTITWDANGNLTGDGQATPTTFGYDTENRLVSASGARTATLTYDPMGRLYQVSNASGTTRFVYDGDQLIAEYSSTGIVQRRYVHGDGVDEGLVWYEGAGVSAATRRYLHADNQGSIIAVVGPTGTTLNTAAYDSFGSTNASSSWRFQYTGQIAIQQVGLYYYKARFYNPILGRFMQTDPVGYQDGPNLYAYVGNDPINKTDPSGLTEFDCTKGTGTSNCDGKAVVKDGDTIKVKGGTVSVSQTGNIVYRETGGLRPSTKEGEGTSADLRDGQKAMAHVIKNRLKAGIKDGVAKDTVKIKYSLNPQFRDAQNAAAEAAAEPDTTKGAKYYVLNQGQAMDGWVKNTHVSQSFGPFYNSTPGDTTTVGDGVYIEIREPNKGYH